MTVEIKEPTSRVLQELATQRGESVECVLEAAVEWYRRKAFLEGLAQDFAELRKDPEAWKEELKERAVWEATLMDGLQEDESPA